MASKAGLKSALGCLKKNVLRLDEQSDKLNVGLLAALVLPTASAIAFNGDSEKIEPLFNLTNQLAPDKVRNLIPLPTLEQLAEARALLPSTPAEIAALDDCMLGYLYQFFCAPKREQALQSVQTSNKQSNLHETIAFTQLYTPSWVADFLIEQCLVGKTNLDELTVLDPACGAGNFVSRAFDFLIKRYLEQGMDAAHAAERIVAHNIYACDIDPLAVWITALTIAVKLAPLGITSCKQMHLDLVSDGGSDDTVTGSLHRDWTAGHILTKHYDAVVGNPPYLGRKLLDRKLKEKLRQDYQPAHQDLCTAFVKRGLEFLKPGGRLGYITQSSLLYLPTYGAFRKSLLTQTCINSITDLGTQIFPLQSGEKVDSILLVIENTAPKDHSIQFADLRLSESKQNDLAALLDNGQGFVKHPQKQFLLHRKSALNFRCPNIFLTLRSDSQPLSSLTEIRQGLATSDNARFVRFWWEVPDSELGVRWMPYVKGGGSERWYSPIETVVDWQNNGQSIKDAVLKNYPYLNGKTNWVVKNEQFYFLEGLTFSLVNTRQLCVRHLPPGCIFDVAGSALFPSAEDRDWLLAYLNSALIATSAEILNPTINYQVGDLKELPVVELAAVKKQLSSLGKECLRLKRSLYVFSDNERDPNVAVQGSFTDMTSFTAVINKLTECETQIDTIVLAQARKQLRASSNDFLELERLCAQAQEKRKPVANPFTSEIELWQARFRHFLYASAPGVIDDSAIAAFAGSAKKLHAQIGCDWQEYLDKHFVRDQKQQLHNGTRVSAERIAEGKWKLS